MLALVRLLDDDNAITRQQTALCLARIATGLDNDDQFKVHLRYCFCRQFITDCFLVSTPSPHHHSCSHIIFLPFFLYSLILSTYTAVLRRIFSYSNLPSLISSLPPLSSFFLPSPTFSSPLLSSLFFCFFLPPLNNFSPLSFFLCLLSQPNIQSCSLEAGTIENVCNYINVISYLNNATS